MSSVKEKLKRIFGYRKFFSSDECTIDSLIRIDRKAYDCDNCILADTINVVRKEGDVMCPMIMEEEVKVLR